MKHDRATYRPGQLDPTSLILMFTLWSREEEGKEQMMTRGRGCRRHGKGGGGGNLFGTIWLDSFCKVLTEIFAIIKHDRFGFVETEATGRDSTIWKSTGRAADEIDLKS
jgi:hypothetical protein